MYPDAVSGGKWGRSRDGCIIWRIGGGDRRMGRGRSRKSNVYKTPSNENISKFLN